MTRGMSVGGVPEEVDPLMQIAAYLEVVREKVDLGRACPCCGWYRENVNDPLWGGFERDGMFFTVCPKCGADWPD